MQRFDYEPASDVGVPLLHRPTSVLREPGLSAQAIQYLTQRFLRLYMSRVHGLTVRGSEHLPTRPPFVMIANHTSHLDAVSLAVSLPRSWASKTYPLAAGDVFFKSLAQASMSSLLINALPVRRRSASRHAIEHLRERLDGDRCVFILFPEGTRSVDGRLGAFKSGLGMLVAQRSVPVVPCHIHGAHACWPRDRRLPRPGRVSVSIGPPLRFDAVEDCRSGWSTVADRCAAAVRDLADSAAGQRS